ncbi:Putative S-adenosyl-L-methionine-dependent methyltransferase [Septoria linicola]|uniref:S-adenosyl-L-methionine-dependent methyltransferase n=1 Tax=Septoria linicola TaxID=215465 RepID=A0A9Q9EGJ4_9PEZI|nr:Putative S-adenosyl-L-methionine-dependent methyltransferase [Septoria linicola]
MYNAHPGQAGPSETEDSTDADLTIVQPNFIIAAGTDDSSNDGDSALGSDVGSLTQSLRCSLLESVTENGRGYHRYSGVSGGQYPLPEDEREQDRSDLQHEMFLYTFGNKLYQSPLGKDVRNVLDIGTGTGIWAIDFADERPEAEVLGTDLSPIQPVFVPPNCIFEIDDFNADWTFGNSFDFIHARALVGSSKDFPAIIRQAYENLNPGGWLEMSDVQVPFLADDGTMEGTSLQEWNDKQVEACARLGVDSTAPSKYKQWMIDQGFEDVTELQFKWPVGTWPKDKWFKKLGQMTKVNFLSGLEGFTLRLWTGVLGMSQAEVLVFLASVRKDISNSRIHSYWPVYSVYGRKPLYS